MAVWAGKSDGYWFFAIIAVALAAVLVLAIAIYAIPFILVGMIVYYGYKYYTRPPPPPSTAELYAVAQRPIPNEDDFLERVYAHVLEVAPGIPLEPILMSIGHAASQLYTAAELKTRWAPTTTDEIEQARYRDYLREQSQKLAHVSDFTSAVEECFDALINHLPSTAFVENKAEFEKPPGTYLIPLSDVLTDKQLITELVVPLWHSELKDNGYLQSVRDRLDENVCKLSKLPFPESRGDSRLIMPDQFKGTFAEAADAYLSGTPFHQLFGAVVPFTIPDDKRLEHTVVVAGSGHGKTQLLQSIVASDLGKDDPPSLIVIDSTGAMVHAIRQLEIFHPDHGRLSDRLIIIDPEDEHAPGLNMFDTSAMRAKNYSRNVQEQIEAETVELFNYCFATVAREMTGRQSGLFSYVVKLMLEHPGSNIHTLRQLLEETCPYEQSAFRSTIERLDATSQGFFKNQFFQNKTMGGTKRQIAERLYDLLKVPAFDRMFSSANKLDMFDAMQSGKIILVNTSINLLKPAASGVFGRFILAKALSAAFERIQIPKDRRRPCFIIVDEASPYTDDHIETLLTKVRQFHVGILLAYQHLEHKEITETVKSALMSSTSIKYAAALGFSDRRYMAREMETTPEFIQAQKRDSTKTPHWAQFACYVRNHTDAAVSLLVPFYEIESQPKMDDEALARLLDANAARVSNRGAQVSEPPPEPRIKVRPPERVFEPEQSPRTNFGEGSDDY